MREWKAVSRCCTVGFCSPIAQTSRIHTSTADRSRTHYQVLGVEKSATFLEIKQAYYAKSKETSCGRPADRKQYDLFLAGVHPFPTGRHPRRHPSGSNSNQWQHWYQHYEQPMGGETFAQRRDRERQSWKRVIYITIGGFTVVSLYNFFYWYRMYQQEKAYERLIAKDEIARSFLRQKEYKDKRDDQLQVSPRSTSLLSLWTSTPECFAKTSMMRGSGGTKRNRTMGVQNPKEIREEARWFAAVRRIEPTKQYKPRREREPQTPIEH
ncbi:J domain-containing protein [Aphelenchoides fujianensis]|nr:J domain-containing protein [Aphelenchoides fujianensis]